ncbi:MAG TPA: hypothetical protein VGF17_09625 [Phytomonospora sp.]
MTSPWPTGPMRAPERAAEPAVEPIPLAVEVYAACESCEHVQCVVARAGAAEICRLVGVEYAALPPEARGHYETVATSVMSVMSEALLAAGAVREASV